MKNCLFQALVASHRSVPSRAHRVSGRGKIFPGRVGRLVLAVLKWGCYDFAMEKMPNFHRKREQIVREGFDVNEESQLRARAQQESAEYEKENPEVVAFFRQTLEQLNFTELNSVFAQEAQRSGVAQEDMNFVPPEQIHIIPQNEELVAGEWSLAYSAPGNLILVNGSQFASWLKEGKDPAELSRAFFRALCHEYAHATGVNKKKRDGATTKRIRGDRASQRWVGVQTIRPIQ
jgi:hypothetical protein